MKKFSCNSVEFSESLLHFKRHFQMARIRWLCRCESSLGTGCSAWRWTDRKRAFRWSGEPQNRGRSWWVSPGKSGGWSWFFHIFFCWVIFHWPRKIGGNELQFDEHDFSNGLVGSAHQLGIFWDLQLNQRLTFKKKWEQMVSFLRWWSHFMWGLMFPPLALLVISRWLSKLDVLNSRWRDIPKLSVGLISQLYLRGLATSLRIIAITIIFRSRSV